MSADLYLALDTSGPVGSVAIGRGAEVLERCVLEHKAEHAARLVPAVDQVLSRSGAAPKELAGIVVGEGPGSFTGVRVAAATAKGLARALSVPLWAVSSLAGAALVAGSGTVRYVLFDARSDRVYGACYGVGSASIRTFVEPHAGNLRDVLAGDVPAGAEFFGDAAERHRAAIEGAGYEVGVTDPRASVADGLLTYLGLAAEQAPVEDAAAWEPRYVRPSSAEPVWTK